MSCKQHLKKKVYTIPEVARSFFCMRTDLTNFSYCFVTEYLKKVSSSSCTRTCSKSSKMLLATSSFAFTFAAAAMRAWRSERSPSLMLISRGEPSRMYVSVRVHV
eukprot:GEZU01023057.1.p2 GENE.GEZU01023057.1~~GEZU01023057.1.p2  ORF type:complete len:105 (+),score=10.42 GEZU01023057.1:68-382(+)